MNNKEINQALNLFFDEIESIEYPEFKEVFDKIKKTNKKNKRDFLQSINRVSLVFFITNSDKEKTLTPIFNAVSKVPLFANQNYWTFLEMFHCLKVYIERCENRDFSESKAIVYNNQVNEMNSIKSFERRVLSSAMLNSERDDLNDALDANESIDYIIFKRMAYLNSILQQGVFIEELNMPFAQLQAQVDEQVKELRVLFEQTNYKFYPFIVY